MSALEQVSFRLFAKNVKTHSSSVRFCRQGIPRRRAAHWMCNDQEQFLSADCHSRVPLTEERSCCLPANDDTGTQSLLR